jgi:hypothetical protein
MTATLADITCGALLDEQAMPGRRALKTGRSSAGTEGAAAADDDLAS